MENVSVALEVLKRAMERADGWSNVFTGLGTTRDKMESTEFVGVAMLSDTTLDELYYGDDMAARACDAVPEEMLRRGFQIKSDDVDSEIIGDLNTLLEDLEVRGKFTDASVWARCFGGCVVVVGADDGTPPEKLREPLNEANIKAITHLNVVDKRYAIPVKWYRDPSSPKYGNPEVYQIVPNPMGPTDEQPLTEVHETRVIRFDGLRCSTRKRQQNNGWGQSLIQRMWQILKDFGYTFQSLAYLLSDANQGVFKMKGLIDALASQDFATIQRRFLLLDMGRSDVRSTVLDAEMEEFQRQNFNWSGIDKPFTIMMLRLSAACRTPVTILMGQSPAGMDATGESDLRWWYDATDSQRNNYMTPKLRQLIKLITLSKDGPTGGKELDKYTIFYPALWQATEEEEANIKKTTSEADKNWIEAGVLLPEEVALSRFTDDGFSTETTIDLEARESILKAEQDVEAMVEQRLAEERLAQQPPPAPPQQQQQQEPEQTEEQE